MPARLPLPGVRCCLRTSSPCGAEWKEASGCGWGQGQCPTSARRNYAERPHNSPVIILSKPRELSFGRRCEDGDSRLVAPSIFYAGQRLPVVLGTWLGLFYLFESPPDIKRLPPRRCAAPIDRSSDALICTFNELRPGKCYVSKCTVVRLRSRADGGPFSDTFTPPSPSPCELATETSVQSLLTKRYPIYCVIISCRALLAAPASLRRNSTERSSFLSFAWIAGIVRLCSGGLETATRRGALQISNPKDATSQF